MAGISQSAVLRGFFSNILINGLAAAIACMSWGTLQFARWGRVSEDFVLCCHTLELLGLKSRALSKETGFLGGFRIFRLRVCNSADNFKISRNGYSDKPACQMSGMI